MAEKRTALEKFTTPKGVLKYPRLNDPDTKFKAEGVYSTKLVLPGDLAAPIVEKLSKIAATMLELTRADLEDAVEAEKGAKKGKLKKQLAELKLADMPFKPVFDDDGNETSDIEFNFKMNAKRTDKKTQKVIEMTPSIFDAKGKALKTVPNIWGGTVARISAQILPFYTALAGAGVGLRLSAVQVIELVSGGGGNAESHGFGEEEGGFEGSDAPAAQSSSTAPAGAEAADDEAEF